MLNCQCTFAVHWQRARLRHICYASNALTARYLLLVLLLQCSFVYKMHPKEKTCSRGSSAQNTHFKSHVCISTSDIPCTITGILHITVSTSLSHIPPIACRCFFWLKLHHHKSPTLYSHIPTRYLIHLTRCATWATVDAMCSSPSGPWLTRTVVPCQCIVCHRAV